MKRPGWLINLGIPAGVVFAIGVALAVLQADNNAQCNSGMGLLAQGVSPSLIQQCHRDGLLYHGGIAFAVIGALAFGLALILALTGPEPPRGIVFTAAMPPGWYNTRPGYVAWWNGQTLGAEYPAGPPTP